MPAETRSRALSRKRAWASRKRTNLIEECAFDWKTLKWPDFNGCSGRETSLTFQVGETYDRFGAERGYFLGDLKNTFDERSMAATKSARQCKILFSQKLASGEQEYHQYRVVKPFTVKTCKIAPFFGHPGGGVQYRLFPGSIAPHEKSLIQVKQYEPHAERYKPNVSEMVALGYLRDLGKNITFPKFSKSFRH